MPKWEMIVILGMIRKNLLSELKQAVSLLDIGVHHLVHNKHHAFIHKVTMHVALGHPGMEVDDQFIDRRLI